MYAAACWTFICKDAAGHMLKRALWPDITSASNGTKATIVDIAKKKKNVELAQQLF